MTIFPNSNSRLRYLLLTPSSKAFKMSSIEMVSTFPSMNVAHSVKYINDLILLPISEIKLMVTSHVWFCFDNVWLSHLMIANSVSAVSFNIKYLLAII